MSRDTGGTITDQHAARKVRSIERSAFATRLRAWRTGQGLQVAALAKTLGIHHNTWYAYEDGMAGPSVEIMSRVAEHFPIDWHAVVVGTPPRNAAPSRVAQLYRGLGEALGLAAEAHAGGYGTARAKPGAARE